MKYIVGASIGGLFGLSMPIMMNTAQQQTEESELIPRQEEFQPLEDISPAPIDNAMHLPDTYCGYINYTTDDIKEQAKECLRRSEFAIPAI